MLPASLFPAATSVRLSGIMTRDLVDCILTQASENIQHLELNNLLQWPDMEPPLPKFTARQDFKQYWRKQGSKHTALTDTRLMAGALDPYVSCCSFLTSLCITTVGRGNYWRSASLWEDRRYSSWARFIDSVRGTLRYLSFKQGLNRNDDASPRGCRVHRSTFGYRDMDHRFRNHILPVLLSAAWPAMGRMEFKGIGRSRERRHSVHLPSDAEIDDLGANFRLLEVNKSRIEQYYFEMERPAFSLAARNELRGLLPIEAEVVVEEEQARDYEVMMRFCVASIAYCN